MTRRFKPVLMAGISTLSITFGYCGTAFSAETSSTSAPAADAPSQSAELEMVVVTARGKPRTVLDSAVPVDSFSEAVEIIRRAVSEG